MQAMLMPFTGQSTISWWSFYIINGDTTGFQLKERLIAKARQGVRVYVLYDEIGSNNLGKGYIRELQRQDIHVHSFGSLKSAQAHADQLSESS